MTKKKPKKRIKTESGKWVLSDRKEEDKEKKTPCKSTFVKKKKES